MAGNEMWLAPLPVLTKYMIENADTMSPSEMQARSAALQARATLEAKVAQERSAEDIIATNKELVAATRALVNRTTWLAVATIVAALVAAVVVATA